MKTLGFDGARKSGGSPGTWIGLGLWTLVLGLFAAGATAAVPLPDHLVYGTIAIDGRPVTRHDTGVTIEARRSAFGPVLASYRMGARAANGDFYYSLRVPVAAKADASPKQAALGESVVITVRTATGIAHQVTHLVTDSGVALRLDFGVGVDTNGDGVPEGWELATFGTTGADLNRDTDGDGASDRAEYFAGTNAKAAGDAFRLAVQAGGEGVQVSFRALRAAGTGWEGRNRFYALESTSDPANGPWQVVANLSRIPGDDRLVVHSQAFGTNAPPFFRARVWLE